MVIMVEEEKGVEEEEEEERPKRIQSKIQSRNERKT